MIAGDEKPELARGGAHSIAQVLQRAYVHNGGQIRAVHHVERILVDDDGARRACACATGASGRRAWRSFRMAIHTRRSSRWSARRICRGRFIERVKDIQVDEFSYFQVHLALKAPVRYALHEAEDPAVGQAMNVNMGPEKPADH